MSQRYTNTEWLQISLPHPQKRIPYVIWTAAENSLQHHENNKRGRRCTYRSFEFPVGSSKGKRDDDNPAIRDCILVQTLISSAICA